MNLLLVEDEPAMRELIASLIDWTKIGYKLVAKASNGVEALKIIKSQKINVLITDLKMPKMNGLDLIRKISEKVNLKIIVLSAYDEFHMVRDAFILGASEYILKSEMTPEQLSSLLLRIKSEFNSNKEYNIDIWENRINSCQNNSPLIVSIRQYIHNNYNDNITLEYIADIWNINKSYLSRVFSEEVGCNFVQYVSCVRIEKAIKLFKNNRKKISEISYEVGFNSPEHFSRVFKKILGISPKLYIQELTKSTILIK